MPKAVFGIGRKLPVFKCFGFKEIRLACCSLWNCEELGGFCISIIIYIRRNQCNTTNASPPVALIPFPMLGNTIPHTLSRQDSPPSSVRVPMSRTRPLSLDWKSTGRCPQ